MGRSKRIVAVLLSFLMIFIYCQETALAIVEQLTPIKVDNGYIEYTVNPNNGRFSIKTVEGTSSGNDRDSLLLFLKEVPETSFTTFRINGEDYIYGNNYDFLGNDGTFTKLPTREGMSTNSVWNIKGLEITQSLELVTDINNPHLGNVKISYRVKNNSGSDATVGARILLDTMLGINDGSPLTLPGSSEFIITERKFDQVPDYWRATNKLGRPDIVSYGLIKGWGNIEPSSMIVAHWQGISRTKWDYTPDPTVNFTNKNNKYGSADSAVALYWDPLKIAPGEEKVFETYYGLGDFRSRVSQYDYTLRVFAPDRLQVNASKDGYTVDSFDIIVEISNGQQIIDYPTVTLDLSPAGGTLRLAQGEEATKQISQYMIPGEIRTVRWKVIPQKQREFTAAQYVIKVDIYDYELDEWIEDMITGGFVMLPSMTGLPPNVQVHGIAPSKMYYKDENMKAALQGSGFGVLMLPDSQYSLKLLKEDDEDFVINVPENFTKVTAAGIEIDFRKEFWQRVNYPAPENESFVIELDASPYGVFRQKIEFTTDEAYKCRLYNILAVVEKNKSYFVMALKDESELAQLKQVENVLLEIKGNVAKRGSVYEIYDGTLINSVVLFQRDPISAMKFGENSQKITVEENSEGVFMDGHGMLSIPSYTFVKGLFKIEFENGKKYSLEPEEEKKEEPVTIEALDTLLLNLFVFPCTIKQAIIGKDSVSFGGTLHIGFFSEKAKKRSDEDTEYEETGIRGGRPGDTPGSLRQNGV